MRRFQLLFVLIMIAADISCACGKDKADASENKVIQKIVTDNGRIGCNCEPVINKYTYQSKTMYAMMSLGPACNTTILFFDATGAVYNLPAEVSHQDFFARAKFMATVWTCRP